MSQKVYQVYVDGTYINFSNILMIKIEFFHDVICSFCFPMFARMRRITKNYNNIEINHRLGHWAHANKNDDEHRFNIEGMNQTDFNSPISKPGLKAAKAAGLIGGDNMYWDYRGFMFY